jgi:hypothetical protein
MILVCIIKKINHINVKRFNTDSILKILLTPFFIFFLISCGKNEVRNIDIYPKSINKSLIIEGSGNFNIQLSDITTHKSFYVRKVAIINKYDSSEIDSYFITVKSIDTNINIYNSLKNKNFTGFMEIESDGQVLLRLEMKNGKSMHSNSPESVNYEFRVKSTFIPTCKFNLIHGCVSRMIKNMGFFEYSLCLYQAPECYGGIWVLCALNYCMTGEQK